MNLNQKVHDQYVSITQKTSTKVYYSNQYYHSKVYCWIKNKTPIDILVGSANFSSAGLDNDYQEFLTKNQDYESFFVANKTHKNYWEYDLNKEKYSRLAKWMSVYSSRQVRKPIFREDTGLTCISRSTLWKEKKGIGDFNKIVEDDRFETSIDIHSSFDLFLANTVFDWMKENKPENLPPMPERI